VRYPSQLFSAFSGKSFAGKPEKVLGLSAQCKYSLDTQILFPNCALYLPPYIEVSFQENKALKLALTFCKKASIY